MQAVLDALVALNRATLLEQGLEPSELTIGSDAVLGGCDYPPHPSGTWDRSRWSDSIRVTIVLMTASHG